MIHHLTALRDQLDSVDVEGEQEEHENAFRWLERMGTYMTAQVGPPAQLHQRLFREGVESRGRPFDRAMFKGFEMSRWTYRRSQHQL